MGMEALVDQPRPQPFQAFFVAQRAAVLRLLVGMVGPTDAEDCFQETFLAALRLWDCQPVKHPRAALLRLATARAVDRLRRRYRESARSSAAAWDRVEKRDTSPYQSAADAELSRRLREALARLPGRQADVFCLHCLEGWAYIEVAQELGVSVDAVGVMLHRARARLRVALADLREDAPEAPPVPVTPAPPAVANRRNTVKGMP